VDIVHFAEAGPNAPDEPVEIALVEGSVSTPEDIHRIEQIRENAQLLITMGACATAGGIQALANFSNRESWVAAIYSDPQWIDLLPTSDPIAQHVKVDFELHGCPVNSKQVVRALRDLLSGITPKPEVQPVCMECKRKGLVCTVVSRGAVCMGPVTLAGCGALCPAMGRGCYGCYGPAEKVNDVSIAERFMHLGLDKEGVMRRFRFIENSAPAFQSASERLQGDSDG
jgi:coenzyme F420-reducing hydrogenase gamma subunit